MKAPSRPSAGALQIMKHISRFRFSPTFFDLDLLVQSHGWSRLSPFSWDDESGILSRNENVDGKIIHLQVRRSPAGVSVTCRSKLPLSEAERNVLRGRSSYMLGLDIDLGEFVRRAKSLDRRIYRFALSGGARMLRGSTLFEDVAKTLFTTNASWAFTRQMCQRLVAECAGKIGRNGDHEFFPSSEMVREMGLPTLTKRCKLGYRAPYLHNVAKTFHNNPELEKCEPVEITDRLSRVKGLGPYCINHIAILLGEYSQIPVDSEVRSYCQKIGLSSKEEAILKYYSKWHPFEFLVFRMERRLAAERNGLARGRSAD